MSGGLFCATLKYSKMLKRSCVNQVWFGVFAVGDTKTDIFGQ